MHILSPETDNCPSWISGRERMTLENISWSISKKACCLPGGGQTSNLLITSWTRIQLSHQGWHKWWHLKSLLIFKFSRWKFIYQYLNSAGSRFIISWMLRMLGKIFSRQHFEIFSYFPQKMDINIPCKLSPKGDNLHGMSKPKFWGKIRKIFSICHLMNLPRE